MPNIPGDYGLPSYPGRYQGGGYGGGVTAYQEDQGDWWDKYYEELLGTLFDRFRGLSKEQELWKMFTGESPRDTAWDFKDWTQELRRGAMPGQAPTFGAPIGEMVGLREEMGKAQSEYERALNRDPMDYQIGPATAKIKGIQDQINVEAQTQEIARRNFLAEAQGYTGELAGHQAGFGNLLNLMGTAQQGLLGAAELGQRGWLGALAGLRGFRGQDIELLLNEMQMEMQTAQARAQGSEDRGGCIVTSACMESKNLPDDCHELQALRKLRDWMKGNLNDGNQLIAEYEGLAPAIVKTINERPDAKIVWSRIYDKFIKTAVDLVEQGNNKVAVKVYKDGVLELAHEYL